MRCFAARDTLTARPRCDDAGFMLSRPQGHHGLLGATIPSTGNPCRGTSTPPASAPCSAIGISPEGRWPLASRPIHPRTLLGILEDGERLLGGKTRAALPARHALPAHGRSLTSTPSVVRGSARHTSFHEGEREPFPAGTASGCSRGPCLLLPPSFPLLPNPIDHFHELAPHVRPASVVPDRLLVVQ